MNDFQTNLDMFLRNRANGFQAPTDGSEAVDRPFGMKISFIGLLFAVLAAGCQNSDMPGKERELTSQVYGKLHQSLLTPFRIVLIGLSVLFIPMPACNELRIKAKPSGDSNSAHYRECTFAQYESRGLICSSRLVRKLNS